jgi:Amt family ammonium transporter
LKDVFDQKISVSSDLDITDGCGDEAMSELSLLIDVMWVMLAAMLVFFMQVGFALLEVGSVQAKNAKSILIKNLLDGAVGTCAWWMFGWGLAYGGGSNAGPVIGSPKEFLVTTSRLSGGTDDASLAKQYANFFFQWAFATTAATIVSGSVAERCHPTAYLIFSFAITAVIYPVVVHWVWSDNAWLADMGFADFAGCGPVHMVGGISGLVGAWSMGPRTGRFNLEGQPNPMKAHNLVLSTVGCMFLWFGWYGFNGGSVLRLSNGGVTRAARAMVTTTISASTGGVMTYLAESYMTGVKDLPPLINGILAGLVSITAVADNCDMWAAFFIGLIGAIVYSGISRFVLHRQIDDPLDAFPLHAGCGIWGVIAVGIFGSESPKGLLYGNFEQLGVQLLGVVVIFIWTGATACAVFTVIDYYIGLRVSLQVEKIGMDEACHGGSAYPDFVKKLGPPTQDVVIVMTDIEGSTELWAFDASLMNHCQVLHDTVMRACLADHQGYEITTEGDAFVMAFHTCQDAINFCFDVQIQLLQTGWPAELLAHPKAGVVLQKDAAADPLANAAAKSMTSRQSLSKKQSKKQSAKETVRAKKAANQKRHDRRQSLGDTNLRRIFNGLRVRMAMDYGYCDHSVHEVTGRYTYTGVPMQNCKAIVDAVQSGGQIVASGKVVDGLAGFESGLKDAHRVDLGNHLLSGVSEPLQLIQFLPTGLRDRELLPVTSIRKLSPAYADAPSANIPRGVPIPPVTMVFTYIANKKQLMGMRPSVSKRIVFCHNAVMRQFLVDHEGYECQEDGGSFMIAFKSPVKACYWAIATHLSFLKMDWSSEPKLVADQMRDLEICVGVHTGIPESVSPHVSTGRADYFGSFVNQSARIGGAAAPGEVLLSSSAFQIIPSDSKLNITMGDKVSLKGIADKVQLYELMVPDEREFDPKEVAYVRWRPFSISDNASASTRSGPTNKLRQLRLGTKKMPEVVPVASNDDGGDSEDEGDKIKLVGEDAIIASVFKEDKENPLKLGAWRINPSEIDLEAGFYVASGSFGDVRTGLFRGTLVAIKTLRRERIDHANVERFKAELVLCRDLRHPNIMQVLGGCWDSADTVMLMTEFCEKGSLSKLLRREGSGHKLMTTKLRWCVEIAKAMCYLHGFRPAILHRDLKCDNVLVNQSLQVKLCDFGESRKAVLEGTMTTVGSPFWMAPEVFMGSRYGEPCDVYSFAICLLEVAHNGDVATVFSPNDESENKKEDGEEKVETPSKKIGLAVAHQVTKGWRPKISKTLRIAVPSFVELVERCWHAKPEKRPNFEVVLDALTKIQRKADFSHDCEAVSDDGSSRGSDTASNSTATGCGGVRSPGGTMSPNASWRKGKEPSSMPSITEDDINDFKSSLGLATDGGGEASEGGELPGGIGSDEGNESSVDSSVA